MRRRTAAVRALVSRDQWQAAARKWHTDYPARGEVAEPGLRRTPGERVNSEGFRGFKSPPLRQSVFNFWHCLESRAKYPRVRGSRLLKVTGESTIGAYVGSLEGFLSAPQ